MFRQESKSQNGTAQTCLGRFFDYPDTLVRDAIDRDTIVWDSTVWNMKGASL